MLCVLLDDRFGGYVTHFALLLLASVRSPPTLVLRAIGVLQDRCLVNVAHG